MGCGKNLKWLFRLVFLLFRLILSNFLTDLTRFWYFLGFLPSIFTVPSNVFLQFLLFFATLPNFYVGALCVILLLNPYRDEEWSV